MAGLVKVHDPAALPAGCWWACQYPRREPHPSQVYDECCPLCQNKAARDMAKLGDVHVYHTDTAEAAKLSDLVGWGLTEWHPRNPPTL